MKCSFSVAQSTLFISVLSGGWFLLWRQSDGRMCEGPSRISGPIPPDPTLFPNYYKRPFSGKSLTLVTDGRFCTLA